MRKAYRAIAWIIVALVAVQAGAVALGVAGEGKYVADGGVVDKALVESAQAGGQAPFGEVVGFMIHGLNGMMVIPVLTLILVAVSFGAGFPGARKWAGITLLLVVVQVNLGFGLHDLPALGALHGINALLLALSAFHAAQLARSPAATAEPADELTGTAA